VWDVKSTHPLLIKALSSALLATLAATPFAAFGQTAQVTVDVDGAPITFDQPPVERAGRVFVPLRGVFERLGATVVYENGTINATSGTHQISLQIGQTAATVDGAAETLDSAPFLIAGRALVPLRFVSQALGASVNFDQQSQTVYLTPAPAAVAATPVPLPVAVLPPPPPPPPPPVAPPPPTVAAIALQLLRLEPARNATVGSNRPELAATFAEPVDPNSVHVSLDGRDVTQDTYVSDRSFVFDPTFDLPDATHAVTVSGRTPDHEPFSESWSFATAATRGNYISGLEPPNGTPARTEFTVSGFTKPRSHVHVIATTSEVIANFSEFAEGSIATDGTADHTGYFAVTVQLPSRAENLVDVRITSTSADGIVVVKTLRLQR
jgi:hypothetical protein